MPRSILLYSAPGSVLRGKRSDIDSCDLIQSAPDPRSRGVCGRSASGSHRDHPSAHSALMLQSLDLNAPDFSQQYRPGPLPELDLVLDPRFALALRQGQTSARFSARGPSSLRPTAPRIPLPFAVVATGAEAVEGPATQLQAGELVPPTVLHPSRCPQRATAPAAWRC
jgi:hypothetical protein